MSLLCAGLLRHRPAAPLPSLVASTLCVLRLMFTGHQHQRQRQGHEEKGAEESKSRLRQTLQQKRQALEAQVPPFLLSLTYSLLTGVVVAAGVFLFDVSISYIHDLPDILSQTYGIGGGRAVGFPIFGLFIPFRCIMPIGAGIAVAALQSYSFSPTLEGVVDDHKEYAHPNSHCWQVHVRVHRIRKAGRQQCSSDLLVLLLPMMMMMNL